MEVYNASKQSRQQKTTRKQAGQYACTVAYKKAISEAKH